MNLRRHSSTITRHLLFITLVGCNGVLGIRAPSDELLDESAFGEGGVYAQTNDASLIDGGVPKSVADCDDAGPADARTIATDAGSLKDDARWPKWPMPNPKATGLSNAQSYSFDDNDLVTDQITKLQWQQTSDDRAYDWKQAAAYCAALAIPGGSFRLPTRIELLSLLDFTAPAPAIDGDAFPDTPTDYFWSSSMFVGTPQVAWVINFGRAPGLVSSAEFTTKYHVRCVR